MVVIRDILVCSFSLFLSIAIYLNISLIFSYAVKLNGMTMHIGAFVVSANYVEHRLSYISIVIK